MQGLYIHIPFCRHKCSYCDFYSIEKLGDIDSFVPVLCSEIAMRSHKEIVGAVPFSSVFFGGGTPSLLQAEQMKRIVDLLRENYSFDDNCEWTMECNPGTVSFASLSAYRSLGINRLSFGVQSLHAAELQFLERIHSAGEVTESVKAARDAGFENINLDVMFAVPGQTMQSYEQSLKGIMALEPEHVSAYSLIYEEGTPLHARLLKGEVQPLPEEVDAGMYEFTIDFLEAHGYHQYEVSNFAKDGFRCRHNLCYWQGQNYVAFGPSAHGYVGDVRYRNARNIGKYSQSVLCGALPTIGSEQLTKEQRMFELIFLTMRSTGIPVALILDTFGCDLVSILQTHLAWMIDEEYLTVGEHVRLTKKGFLVCDDITLSVVSAVEGALGLEWKRAEDFEEESGDELQHDRESPNPLVSISMP